jgi:cytochrome c oxidase subunit 3
VGAINTAILLTSSLTVALSITAIQKGDSKKAFRLIIVTIIFALAFLVNKYFEWHAKYDHGLFPGMEHFKELSHGESQFFFLYFFMTGLHAIHVIVGAVLLGVIAYFIKKGTVNKDRYIYLENGGLYWHLVDVIWIYLFPLFYLII